MFELTPTASWWFTIGDNAPFMKVISLGETLIETDPDPEFGWSIMTEHWGIRVTITDVAATLGVATSSMAASNIAVSMNYYSAVPNPPTAELIEDASAVADPAQFRFLAKAKSKLNTDQQTGDWTKGKPPMGGGTKIFYQQAGEVTDESPRLLFELTADAKGLARITWLARVRHKGFPGPFTLEEKTMPTEAEWKDWLYYSIETKH